MTALQQIPEKDRYAKCIEISKRVRWDIDTDVIRGREFDLSRKFLPDGISGVDRIDFLGEADKRWLSQVQGRTYANMFGFVERFITAKVLEITREHWLDDQVALEALVRFCDEELKHQELFRRIEALMIGSMPPGYIFVSDPNAVAAAVLKNSTWAVLGVILEIELFTQEHYKQSIEPDENLSDLFKDLFLFHWKEETTHAIMDELEWPREDAKLTPEQRDRAVDELIGIVADFDGILKAQGEADIDYFLKYAVQPLTEDQVAGLRKEVLRAYRRQYIFSGVEHPRYADMIGRLTTDAQMHKIQRALSGLASD